MRIPRIHTSARLATGTHTELNGDAARHLGRVLRAQTDTPVILFNGDGYEYAGRVVSVTRDRVEIALGERLHPRRESPLAITLIQGVSRGERMDYAIQKAVELGVNAIAPVLAQRTVVRLDGERAAKRREHWQSVAISACEQAGRLQVPEVAEPVALAAWQATHIVGAETTALVLDPEAAESIAELARPTGGIVVAIGPEGGFADSEIASLRESGFHGVRLGPRILRTETAAVAALSVLQNLWGDFGA